MKQLVVTSGKGYIDIDAYASLIAYRELLAATGRPAIAVSSVQQNDSIPQLIRELGPKLDTFAPAAEQQFIVLDVSDPEQFDPIVDQGWVVEVIDHHTGHEAYWAARSSVQAEIEFIGAVCTLIFEKFVAAERLDLLSPDLCRLLTAGILDNTLNLQAAITTERDRTAYTRLLALGKLDATWSETYFRACQTEILAHLANAIKNDIKTIDVDRLPRVFGQLLVHDATSVLAQESVVRSTMDRAGTPWIFNLISLADGQSRLLFSDEAAAKNVAAWLPGERSSATLALDHFMLRKEIIKRAREH